MSGAPCWRNRFEVLEVETCIDNVDCNTSTPSAPEPVKAAPPDRALVLRAARSKNSFEVKVQLESLDARTPIGTDALVDCGASGDFIDLEFAKANHLVIDRMPRAIELYNIDGTLNSQGAVQYTTSLVMRLNNHTERITLFATNLGGMPLVLGMPWLRRHNPLVDWQEHKLEFSRCPSECRAPAHPL